MCFRCFGLFLINKRVYLKGKLKFAYPKETGSWVCNIIPRAFGVKYLLQRTLCLILLKRFFFQIKSTTVASSYPL